MTPPEWQALVASSQWKEGVVAAPVSPGPEEALGQSTVTRRQKHTQTHTCTHIHLQRCVHTQEQHRCMHTHTHQPADGGSPMALGGGEWKSFIYSGKQVSGCSSWGRQSTLRPCIWQLKCTIQSPHGSARTHTHTQAQAPSGQPLPALHRTARGLRRRTGPALPSEVGRVEGENGCPAGK